MLIGGNHPLAGPFASDIYGTQTDDDCSSPQSPREHSNLGLILDDSILRAVHASPAVERRVEANLAVDLLHALGVGRGRALGAEDEVHLLEGQTLGLGDEEPDEAGAQGGDDAEEDVGAVVDLCEQVGRDLADDEVVPAVGVSFCPLVARMRLALLTYIQLLDAPRETP